jgi:lysophospholipase L1-like esterase
VIKLGFGLLLAAAAFGGSASAADKVHWVTTWGTSQMIAEGANALPAEQLSGTTVRQLIRTSIGGQTLRVRISNAFGTAPLVVRGAHIARSANLATPNIAPGTDRPLTFGGSPSVTIPAGAEYLSDPVKLTVAPLSMVAISLHLAEAPKIQTGHPGSRATSWILAGDQLSAATPRPVAQADHWYLISGVEVLAKRCNQAIALLGDSITDGYGVKPNTNLRWTDALAERLQKQRGFSGLGIVNLGIGGNRILRDGLGPNAAARFQRDVLSRPGIKHLIIFEGVNDLGTLTRDKPVSADEHRQLVTDIIAAYRQMIAAARERGIRVYGATILPYGASEYYHPNAENEADRQAINAWIRAPGNFDGLIDFDAAMRDPNSPNRLRKDYDSGDGLHPSMAGYRAMGDMVPLKLFAGSRC